MMGNARGQASPAIEGLSYIQNIGRFESTKGAEDTAFAPLTLIFSENGCGKTTLCAILRSLTTGDPAPILERSRLSATTESRAVVKVAGSTVAFNGAGWTAAGPCIAIFDEHFVDANVHSGLNVDAGHRKGLHELVVGEEGVRLQREVEHLADQISSLHTELRQKESAIPAAVLGSLAIDEFCTLSRVQNLEKEIEEAALSLDMLQNADAIRSANEFNRFTLPALDLEELVSLLATTVRDVEAAAVAAVTRHFSGRGPGMERWASDGLRYLGKSSECPFCGLNVSGSTLIGHYRAYFSEAYATHKHQIQTAREVIGLNLSGDRLAALQRTLHAERERRDFWARYFELPAFTVDLNELADAWSSARDELLTALDTKSAAPLEPLSLAKSAEDAARRYREMAESVNELSSILIEQNSTVRQIKEHAVKGTAHTEQARLERLQAVERRFRPDIDSACRDYLGTRKRKREAEEAKTVARKELNEHRRKVFRTCQAAINRFLASFNADFSLDQLKPSDAAGVPSSTYGVRLNAYSVGLNPPETPSPSFRTALSAGDRNTLALAFFFTSLERLDLDSTTVVIDDPISSLDEARTYATVREMRELMGHCEQLVVLSHSRGLLCQLWEKADKDNTATLEIRDDGPNASSLARWDIEAAALSEFDRLHRLVREYAESGRGDAQVVARDLRILLESFLRVAFVAHFEPGTKLGTFIQRAKQRLRDGSPILSGDAIRELDHLRDYANRFHHSTNKMGLPEALANVNQRELRGFAKRVLDFITLDGRLLARQPEAASLP